MTNRHRSPCSPRTALALTWLVTAPLAGCLAPDAEPGGEGGAGAGGSGAGAAASAGYGLDWVKTYGLDEDFDKRALSVAATPEGGALLAGEFEGSLTLDSIPELPNTEGRDGFVALFGENGAPAWSLAFSGFGDQRVFRALPLPGGGVVLGGVFTGALVVDGADEGDAPEGSDGFVAHIGAGGSLDWLVRVTGPGDQAVHSIALTTTGDILIAGYFENTLVIGDLDTAEQSDWRDFFVAKLSPTGQPLWGTSLGGDPGDVGWFSPVCLVAADDDGGAHVAGTFGGTIRLGQNLGAVSDRDLFVGKLTAGGEPVWGHAAGDPSFDQYVGGLAVNGAGEAVLSGHVRGEVPFDAQATLVSDGPEPDAFLAVYDALGELAWARRYGSKAADHGGAVAFGPDGDILFTGRYRGSIHFGDEPVLHANDAVSGNDDIFLATLTPAGAPLAVASFGKADDQYAASVAATAGGDVLLGGFFRGIVDFGDGEIDALTGTDMFVATLTSPGK